MASTRIAPYGSWKSPITSDLIVAETISLGAITIAEEETYWIEVRPAEGGRYVIVQRSADGSLQDITPQPYNVRTRVHEYGGGSYLFHQGRIYFTNFSDQRLYQQDIGVEPEALTAEGEFRYADFVHDPIRQRLICVREDHSKSGHEAVNTISVLELDTRGEALSTGKVLISGNDFYSNPRVSPDGKHLAWLSWNHPNLPWDGTELWIGEFSPDGSIENRMLVAGGEEESIFQPEWSPDGKLYFVSDRTGWWNLYRWQGTKVEGLLPMQAEFGFPQWGFGTSAYGFESSESLLSIYIHQGEAFLGRLNTADGGFETIDLPYTDLWGLRVKDGRICLLAGSASEPASIIELDPSSGETRVIRRTSSMEIDPGYLSMPETIEFPTENNLTAFGFYYPPRNQDFSAPPGELPPLLVMSHGGPTYATSTVLSADIQYWTSRGIGVLDVNYGGSTGYGREYRLRLNGMWGVVDVDDCVNGALFMVQQRRADPQRLAITGGSAGGYTTLCALTFREVFKAGASHFGIGDLEPFVTDTHKFESRYLDRLVGPYPERKDLYIARSPIRHMERLSTPMILLQGMEDKIVPPNQAEMMFEAVKAKGLPVAYLPFEGEQHGFRKAENIKRALDAELYFYSRIFGFELADPVEPVEISNL